MYISGVSLYNNQQNIKNVPSFKMGIKKPLLNNNVTKSSSSKTIDFSKKILDYFKSIFKTNKMLEQKTEVSGTQIKNLKLSETKVIEMLKIPKNGVLIRNGYEEHYKNGKIVKKILRPESYAEHTRIINSRVEYVYDGDELKQIHNYDTINGDEIMVTRKYTNLGNASVTLIRDL